MSMPDLIFQSKSYKRSRSAYKLQCAFEYFITFGFTDSVFAVLAMECGFSDDLIGLLASFSGVAFLFQLLTAVISHHIKNSRRFSLIFHLISDLSFFCIYILPFLSAPQKFLAMAVAFGVVAAYGAKNIATPLIYYWGNSYVEPTERAAFSAGKEALSLLGGLAVSLSFGYIIDLFRDKNDVRGSFVFILIFIGVFAVADMITLLLIDKKIGGDMETSNEAAPKLTEVFQSTLGSRSFRLLIYMSFFHGFAVCICSGFLGTYKIKELGMSLTLVQILSCSGSLLRALLSKSLGRFSDKHSYAVGYELGTALQLAGFLIMIFTAPTSWWLMIGYILLGSLSGALTTANLNNMSYCYVERKYIVQAMALLTSLHGIGAFLGSLVGGRVVSTIQALPTGTLSLFGCSLYAQQFLAICTSLMLIVIILFQHFVIRKLRKTIQ